MREDTEKQSKDKDQNNNIQIITEEMMIINQLDSINQKLDNIISKLITK